MSLYVTDTHALIWYLTGSSKLGDQAHQIFDDAVRGEKRIVIPAIVVAEIVLFAEKHHSIEPKKIWATLRKYDTFVFAPLLPEIAEKIQDLSVLPDIHDRLIVSEALAQKATLITLDKKITESKLTKTIW